jgi:ankyrin repeat protein
MWAAEQRHPEAVKALLAAGADPGIASGPAGLPRNYMAPRVDVNAVQEARQRRARATAAGRTYDEQVAFERRNPVAASPGGRPADASPVDDDVPVQAGLVGTGGGGLTALVFAAREGDVESAKALLDRGARINQTTEYGWTPLLTAVNNRNYALAKMLIERGADVNIANKGGWTPLYLATDNRNIEGGDYPVPKPDLDHLEIIKALLQHGANPNARVRDNTLTRTIFTMQWFFEDGATAFVRGGVQSATAYPETAALIRTLMRQRGLPVPPENRNILSICVVALCQ